MVHDHLLKSGLKLAAAASVAAGVLLSAQAQAEEVNVYSYRQPFLIQPMFDVFTRETGIDVNVVFAKKGLVERLKQEGINSPADLIFTVDIARLKDVKEAGLTQPIKNNVLESNIPANLRDPDGSWFALTTRARIIYASKDRVPVGTINDYEDLADSKLAGKVCTRSGTHVYNIALVGSLIEHHGRDGAKDWLSGVKNNLARKPEGNDRAQVKAIKEGECDVAIGNHYYMGKMLADEEQYEWAQSVYLIFPNQGNRGTHVNVSGVALTKASPNRDNAVALMEFLSGDLAQQMYAEQNFEYPVKPGAQWSGLLKSWGSFKTDSLNLAKIAKNSGEATKIVNEVGFNE